MQLSAARIVALDLIGQHQETLDGLLAYVDEEARAKSPSGVRRMLRVPEAHLTALWFRDKLGSSEEVVLIAPAPSEFVAFRRYTAADFLQTAALLARRNVDLYSSGRRARRMSRRRYSIVVVAA